MRKRREPAAPAGKPAVLPKRKRRDAADEPRKPEPEAAKATSDRVDVFDYLDYRAFLRDYYIRGKSRGTLSFRGFSRRARLGSPNYLKLVIDGDRNITEAMAERFAAAAGLVHDGASYFRELVRFTQAKSIAEQAEHYQRLTGFRRYRQIRPLDAAQAAYHFTWYYPAVRELAARADFREEPRWIAETLWPSISVAQAREALETLVSLGLLVRDAEGRLGQGDPLLSTGAEVRSLHVARYHLAMLERAASAIEAVPAEQRDISSLTLCLGADGIRRLKLRLRAFRRELLELSSLEQDPKQVVQLNLQLFPLSRLGPNE